MSVGTLIFLLLIGGSLIAMFAMHRGGQSHSMGMGCGGHDHGSSEDHRHTGESHDGEGGRMAGETGDHSHNDEPAGATRHRGC